jgi:tetratricopeptide (TPR) repeat protein
VLPISMPLVWAARDALNECRPDDDPIGNAEVAELLYGGLFVRSAGSGKLDFVPGVRERLQRSLPRSLHFEALLSAHVHHALGVRLDIGAVLVGSDQTGQAGEVTASELEFARLGADSLEKLGTQGREAAARLRKLVHADDGQYAVTGVVQPATIEDSRLIEANALKASADLYMRTDRLDLAEDSYKRALTLYQHIDDKLGEANTLKALGDLFTRTNSLELAQAFYEQTLSLLQRIDDKLGEANILRAMGDLYLRTDRLRLAQAFNEQALALFQRIDDKLGEANILKVLGDLYVRTNSLELAQAFYEQALALFQRIDDKLGESNTLKALGDLYERTDRLELAQASYEEALSLEIIPGISEGAAEIRKHDPKMEEHLWALKTKIEESRKDATRVAVQAFNNTPVTEPAPRPLRLLHLSDLHFTANTPIYARLQWLLDDLKTDNGLIFKELDYLVVSGDFTDRASPEGFERAYEFLSNLIAAFALSAERCILVPGNHDVSELLNAYTLRKDAKGLCDGEWVQQGSMVLARDPEKYPQRFKPFSDGLYHKFLQRPYSLPAEEQGLAIPFWETGIQFLTFNSCWEIDEFNRKRAGIHPMAVAHALQQAKKQVEDGHKSGALDPNKKILRIAVWHHALTAPDYKMKDLQFLGHLKKNGVKLALHGDIHLLRRECIGYWHESALHVTAAGSFGARAEAESIPRLYNVLEIERDFSAIKVHTRQQYTPDGYWDGCYQWPNPDGSESLVPYYTITLPWQDSN